MSVISFFFYFLFFFLSKSTANGGGDHGVTTLLFHRDSPLSPLHNSSLSPYDRLTKSLRRSITRAADLHNRAAAGIQSPIIPSSGEFLMSISIGTPPANVIAIADTGSDLTWTQCMPCQQCFNQSLPLFNPAQSTTYRHVSCTSSACHSLDNTLCGPHLGTCSYKYTYGDNSFTYGDLASDQITIGSLRLNGVVFGCGHRNGGVFGGASSGIIGLGGGSLSFVSQLTKTAAVVPKFSYCLPDFVSNANLTGEINFGQNAVVSGNQVVSTPLVSKSPNTYYYFTLEAISVANSRFEVSSAAASKGNMIIDSGTTMTFIPQNLYDGVVSRLRSVIKGKAVDDPFGYFELCYAVGGGGDDLDIPVVTAHFGGGADVKLLAVNTFVKVAQNVSCLALAPTMDLGIFGNLAQINFLIGYDLHGMTLSFKPTVCS